MRLRWNDRGSDPDKRQFLRKGACFMTDNMQDPVRDAAERRRFPRFESDRVFRFSRDDGGQLKSIARIVNVSGGGVQFTSHDPIAPDTVLRLDLDGSHYQGPLTLRGLVVWSDPVPDEHGLYYSGVNFVDVGDDIRPLILSAVT